MLQHLYQLALAWLDNNNNRLNNRTERATYNSSSNRAIHTFVNTNITYKYNSRRASQCKLSHK